MHAKIHIFLLSYIQLTHTQAVTKEIQAVVDGVSTKLLCNKSYGSGVKMCAAETALILYPLNNK